MLPVIHVFTLAEASPLAWTGDRPTVAVAGTWIGGTVGLNHANPVTSILIAEDGRLELLARNTGNVLDHAAIYKPTGTTSLVPTRRISPSLSGTGGASLNRTTNLD
ncbi:MAG: hypothetical protein ACJAR2_003001 [Ilumatobacter sp.]|jgi:hypothetical protein